MASFETEKHYVAVIYLYNHKGSTAITEKFSTKEQAQAFLDAPMDFITHTRQDFICEIPAAVKGK